MNHVQSVFAQLLGATVGFCARYDIMSKHKA